MKKKIIEALIKAKGDFLSGEDISQLLGVSRTAVWKHIKQLKSEGYTIESVTNRGYRLVLTSGHYNEIAIEMALKENHTYERFIKKVMYFDIIDSTNQQAKKMGQSGCFENTLIVSNEQTSGKGRLGRTWDSQRDHGIFMTLLLKPDISPESAPYFTMIASTAVAKAIDKITGIRTQIKWPNDIVLNGKKLCGILTELSAEINCIHYLVIGIGINISQTEFEPSLKDKAIALNYNAMHTNELRLKIIQEFVECFEIYYNQFVHNMDLMDVVSYNREHSATLNKKVHLIYKDQIREAYAKDLDAFGRLIVINEAEQEEVISTGEVSVRGLNGYV